MRRREACKFVSTNLTRAINQPNTVVQLHSFAASSRCLSTLRINVLALSSFQAFQPSNLIKSVNHSSAHFLPFSTSLLLSVPYALCALLYALHHAPSPQPVSLFCSDLKPAIRITLGQAIDFLCRAVPGQQNTGHAGQYTSDEMAYALGRLAVSLRKGRIPNDNAEAFCLWIKLLKAEMPPADLISHLHHEIDDFPVREIVKRLVFLGRQAPPGKTACKKLVFRL